MTNKLVLVASITGSRVHLSDPKTRKRSVTGYLHRSLCREQWVHRPELVKKGSVVTCERCKEIMRRWWT